MIFIIYLVKGCRKTMKKTKEPSNIARDTKSTKTAKVSTATKVVKKTSKVTKVVGAATGSKKTVKTTEAAKPAGAAKVAKSSGRKNQTVSHGVGRRKRAVARVWLRRGSGKVLVNGKDYKQYFDTDLNRDQAYIPFKVVKITNYDADINVYGGGVNSQAEAIKLGISRALVSHNPDIRPELRKFRLLSVDSRVKERKKYGQRGARRKFQFVKR